MTSVELTIQTSCDLLKRFIDVGYKSTGVLSIKEGAILHKYFRVLKKTEEDESLKEQDMFRVIFKALELFNSSKAYTLEDAAVLDKIIDYVNNHFKPKEV